MALTLILRYISTFAQVTVKKDFRPFGTHAQLSRIGSKKMSEL